jgi:4a-hydroxytetrahydrobiopterin dehydratase
MGKYIGLGARECQPAALLAKLDDATLERLRQQVPGWRVVPSSAAAPDGASLQCVRREWAARDPAAAEELAARLRGVAQQAGHAPLAVAVQGAAVAAELATPAAGGLTENDFIVASRLNALEGVDALLEKKRQRFWA